MKKLISYLFTAFIITGCAAQIGTFKSVKVRSNIILGGVSRTTWPSGVDSITKNSGNDTFYVWKNGTHLSLKDNRGDTSISYNFYKQAFYISAFDTSSRVLTLTTLDGSTATVLIPRGTASGTSGIVSLSNSVSSDSVTISGDNGSHTTFSRADARISSGDISNWNGKQNLINLTTTGTSSASTFNQTTGALNIPNYGSAGSTWSGMVYGTSYTSGNTTLTTSDVQYTFTGTSPATWTLSSYASPGNFFYFIKNIGSANLTVQAAGSDSLYATSKVKSFVITPGQSAAFSSASSNTANLWTILFSAQPSDTTKQNLVALTTAGTSGVSTFNPNTGALNIPNYASVGALWNGYIGGTTHPSSSTVTIAGNGAVTTIWDGAGSSTWTLPDRATYNQRMFFFKNAGGGTVTVVRAGSDSIYTTSLVTSFTLSPGQSILIQAESTYWYTFFPKDSSGGIITLTSDVTGSGTGSFATTIAAGAVTLTKMANMATASLIYRKTAGTGVPEVNTLATLKTDLALAKADVGLSSVDNTSNTTERAATATLTNKRWTARVGNTTSSATPTINTDNYDVYKLTAQTADITSFTTNLSGTPVDGDILEIQVTGTAARAITWGTSFVSSTVTLPTTTVTTATLTTIFQYYTTSSYGNNKFVCVNYY